MNKNIKDLSWHVAGIYVSLAVIGIVDLLITGSSSMLTLLIGTVNGAWSLLNFFVMLGGVIFIALVLKAGEMLFID